MLLLLPTIILAATDGVEVNLSVTGPGPGGGGPTIIPTTINGCTDPLATNYSSTATNDDGSCQYVTPIANVSNFIANYLPVQNRIVLTWTNPDFPEFSAARVVRQAGSVPAGPLDGLLIYDGTGQAAIDETIAPGQTYFYAAFVRATNGNYSSGVIVSATVPSTKPEDKPPVVEPPSTEPSSSEPPGGGGPGGGSPLDPFQFFPTVIDPDPLIQKLDLGDFIFSQLGERPRFFLTGDTVPVVVGKDLSVSINYDRLPESLKTIGLTIVDPADRANSKSFTLRINENKTAYVANLGVLYKNGLYPIYIYIINFKNQTVKHLTGILSITNGQPQTPFAAFSQKVAQTAQPIVTVVGLGAGLSQALALTNQINSFSDLYFLIIHFWTLLLRVLGLRKRRTPWGVVYDSVTKRPLDPAYVIAKREDTDAATAITDLDGRYGFLLPPAGYTLMANKTHYRFPSLKLQGKNHDELYDGLYFGEPFTTASGEVINRNIPLDPVAFDWNEFAKQQQGFFVIHSRRERRRALIYNTLFGLGLVLAFYQLLFWPSVINLVLPVLYAGVFLLKYIWRTRHPITVVRRAETGLPVPFAIIRAFIPSVNQQVKSVVADALGRFFFLTPPGEYYFTVEEKLPDESYQKIYQSENMKLDKGILTEDLTV
ncbi:MAG: hypothetical protein AAB677_00790 [Patescibacteria group bacterium]